MIPDERLAETIERKNIPISASIELTWRCNLKCLFCYQYKPGDNELSTKEIKNIMDQLKEEGCLYLALTGGEPMTHPDFWEISEHARKNSFAVTLQTNGTLITPDIAKKIKELNFFSVHISLLGATAETHDTLSGKKGSFEKVINAAKSLKTSGVNVVFKTTVVKQNFGELGRIIDMADELGVQKTFSPVVYARSDGDLTPLRFRLDDDELREFYREMFRRTPGAMEPYRNGEFGPVCQFGRTDCCINSEGKIYPCVSVPACRRSEKRYFS